MAVELLVKKWGNSLGVIFPKGLVEKNHLKLNKVVLVEIIKKGDISNLLGIVKRKMSGQEFKDLVREGWK